MSYTLKLDIYLEKMGRLFIAPTLSRKRTPTFVYMRNIDVSINCYATPTNSH